jgi:hypothetical protein
VLGLAQAPVGSVSGIVHDSIGGVMQMAAITVTNDGTSLERKAMTSADGAFAFPSLPAGEYVVKAAAAGFRTLVENATVQVGRTTTVELVMQVGEASEILSVQEEDAPIDYQSHTVFGVIPRERIENLPLKRAQLFAIGRAGAWRDGIGERVRPSQSPVQREYPGSRFQK